MNERLFCRYCLDDTGIFVQPCKCKGTIAHAHRECIHRLVNSKICQFCHETFYKNDKNKHKEDIEMLRKHNRELRECTTQINNQIQANVKRMKQLDEPKLFKNAHDPPLNDPLPLLIAAWNDERRIPRRRGHRHPPLPPLPPPLPEQPSVYEQLGCVIM